MCRFDGNLTRDTADCGQMGGAPDLSRGTNRPPEMALIYNRSSSRIPGVSRMIKFLQSSNKLVKILFGAIILYISVAMLWYLIPGFNGAQNVSENRAGVLATVGDEEVTVQDAQRQARQAAEQQLGPKAGTGMLPFFMERAIQELINRKAMAYEAGRMGLHVSDEEVVSYLQHGPWAKVLFPEGQFVGPERYESIVEQNSKLTVPQFEQAVQEDILLGKLGRIVEGSATVSDEDLRREYVRKNTKVKFDYAVLTLDDVMKQMHPADAELKAYFDKNRKFYENSIPEKRKFQYALVDPEKLKQRVPATSADLRSYYQAHIEEYRLPEEVRLRHILVSTPPGADPKTIEAARAKAQDILKKLNGGAKFEELAKQLSDDEATKKDGGEMGWIQRGRTDPAFEKAAFSLAPGQTSEVVQTALGFSIIQVEEKQAAHVKPLDEVKAQIEPALVQQKAAALAEGIAGALRVEARKSTVAALALKYTLEVMNSPLVTKEDSVPGIGDVPEFMNVVFAAGDNAPPEIVRLTQGYAIVQVTGVQPAATPAFEEIKAKVEEDFKHARAAQLLQQKAQELSDRARAGHDLKKAAAEAGAGMKTSELVGPDSQVPEIGSLAGPAEVIFAMKPGEISGPITTTRASVVVALTEKDEPPPGGFEAEKDQLRDTLLSDKRTQLLDLFLDGLRQRLEKEGKIHINKQEMDRLLPKNQTS
jgi:peptidyl-prolyl cis-trans isomerase D